MNEGMKLHCIDDKPSKWKTFFFRLLQPVLRVNSLYILGKYFFNRVKGPN